MSASTLTKSSALLANKHSATKRRYGATVLQRIASGDESALELFDANDLSITVMRVLLAMPFTGRTKALRICDVAQVNGALMLSELTTEQRVRLREAASGVSDPRRLTLYPNSSIAVFYGRNAKLTRVEFRVLQCLAKFGGDVVTLGALMGEVWPQGFAPTAATVRTHISRIRAKLGNGLIETVEGIGFYVPAEAVGRVAA